jgi:hypothetical protein
MDDRKEWIPLRQAVAEVTEVYQDALKGTHAEARSAAIKALTRWLAEAACTGKSARWGVNFFSDGKYRRGIRSDNYGEKIPSGLWRYVQGLGTTYADWVSGEFLCEGQMHAGSHTEVAVWAYDVFIERRGIPLIGGESNPSSADGSVSNGKGRRRGRPRKWNWDEAIYAIIAEANKPDGLPDGYGAQAEVGRMLAQWFRDNQNGEPASSEIGARAAKIMAAISEH